MTKEKERKHNSRKEDAKKASPETHFLLIANELKALTTAFIIQNKEKEAHAAELVIANSELQFQNIEKEKRAAELAEFHIKNDVLIRQFNHIQKLESIDRLTSGIAHDFNNILMCMLGFNELNKINGEDISDELLRKNIENNCNKITLAGTRATALIDKMLIYCRQDFQPEDTINVQSTSEVINEVLSMLRPALTSRIAFETEVEHDLIIKINEIDLHQILINLAVNARDAMKHYSGVITMSLKTVKDLCVNCVSCAKIIEGEFIQLSVTDNGTGIDPKIISRLFDPFFTTKPVGEGTGLGLSAVSGLVHKAGGHILIDSNQHECNHGTAFILLFPIPTNQSIPD